MRQQGRSRSWGPDLPPRRRRVRLAAITHPGASRMLDSVALAFASLLGCRALREVIGVALRADAEGFHLLGSCLDASPRISKAARSSKATRVHPGTGRSEGPRGHPAYPAERDSAGHSPRVAALSARALPFPREQPDAHLVIVDPRQLPVKRTSQPGRGGQMNRRPLRPELQAVLGGCLLSQLGRCAIDGGRQCQVCDVAVLSCCTSHDCVSPGQTVMAR